MHCFARATFEGWGFTMETTAKGHFTAAARMALMGALMGADPY